MTNQELGQYITALGHGDKAAFEAIYQNLNTPMYTLILRIIGDKALAEDVLQEVFVKLYVSPPLSVKNPRAYLFQAARNLAIDVLRKQPKDITLEDWETLPCPSADDTIEKIDVENALMTLPSEERQIVSLHINGQFKFREIAEICKLPLGTVLWKYRKAIKHLRYMLSGGAL